MNLPEKIKQHKKTDNKIKTWSRRERITKDMIGSDINIHNGKIFIKVSIAEDMVGKKIGELSPTKKLGKHTESRYM